VFNAQGALVRKNAEKERGSVVAIKILLCYAYDDEGMKNELKAHLSPLERISLITIQDPRNIDAGSEWKQAMETYLNEAQVILLLASSSFIDSDYCYKMQMQRAIEHHEHKEARVIPVILRPVYLDIPPFDKLQALPDESKPITRWAHRDDGFENVVVGIAKVVKQWNTQSLPDPQAERKAFMADLDQTIEAVKAQLQPQPRAIATANTLQQLSIFIPNDVTLADLLVGWRTLAHPLKEGEDPATAQRRITCDQLADIAAQFTTAAGSLAQAIKTWRIWRDAFQKSDDARQAAMAKTFARELSELQDAAH
jgi:TIR domain